MAENHPLPVIPRSAARTWYRTGSFRSNFAKSGCSANDPIVLKNSALQWC